MDGQYVAQLRHTLSSYHIGNLDDRIDVSLGEYTLSTRTLNIEAEYSERSQLGPLPVRRMRDEIVPPASELSNRYYSETWSQRT